MAKISIQPLEHMFSLPAYQTAGSAGMDLHAAIPEDSPITLKYRDTAIIPLGFCMAIPQGLEAQIRSRSGLAAKHGVVVLNSPGTIDSDYRGEVMVMLTNHGRKEFKIERGMRVAQMVLATYRVGDLRTVEELDDTERGTGGFGSTGQ